MDQSLLSIAKCCSKYIHDAKYPFLRLQYALRQAEGKLDDELKEAIETEINTGYHMLDVLANVVQQSPGSEEATINLATILENITSDKTITKEIQTLPELKAKAGQLECAMQSLVDALSTLTDEITITGHFDEAEDKLAIQIAAPSLIIESEQLKFYLEPFKTIGFNMDDTAFQIVVAKKLIQDNSGMLLIQSSPESGTTLSIDFYR